MANKQDTGPEPSSKPPVDAMSQLQEAGLGNLMGAGAAWMEALSGMGAEVASFIADRIKEDVKTQHQILHCKDVGEIQKIQAKFVKDAVEQYQAETGKLVEIGTKAFASKTGSKDKAS